VIKKKRTLRYFLLSVGAILAVVGNVAFDTGHANGEVGTVVGVIMAIIGCDMWVRDKNQASVFSLWGLLAPIGYLAIMALKDKSDTQLKCIHRVATAPRNGL
jgi:uncharacterized membrane protein